MRREKSTAYTSRYIILRKSGATACRETGKQKKGGTPESFLWRGGGN